jgi:hypothetical protein
MTELYIQPGDLLKWADWLGSNEMQRELDERLADALNTAGNDAMRAAAAHMADITGVDVQEIIHHIDVTEATVNDLSWVMDASSLAPPSLDWRRPWDKPSDGSFDRQALVNILTMDDDVVCETCEQVAEDGPYTLERAQELLSQSEEYLPNNGQESRRGIHINCRCLLGPFSSLRRIPVAFGSPTSGDIELLNTRQLGVLMGQSVLEAIRSKKL